MQIITEPRLVTEPEDTHLIRTFLFSTKENEADWQVPRKDGHKMADEWLERDFVIIPERIFKPLDEGRGGHVASGDYDSEMTEIKRHSHGKIKKIYGPFTYPDITDDYWYEAGIKLNGSKAASVLLENGSKTWEPFSVSPHVWSHTDGKLEPMGLFLVIKGAYGKEAVISKMCTGSELKMWYIIISSNKPIKS